MSLESQIVVRYSERFTNGKTSKCELPLKWQKVTKVPFFTSENYENKAKSEILQNAPFVIVYMFFFNNSKSHVHESFHFREMS